MKPSLKFATIPYVATEKCTMPQLQSFGISAPNLTAAAEQLCLCACVYNDQRTTAETLLGGVGAIRVWHQYTDSWLPSYAIIEQPGGRWFVVIEGTTNIEQAQNHLWGSFQRSDYFSPASCNGQWLNAYQGLKEDAYALIPPGLPPDALHISGHSYGGALAFVCALDFTRNKAAQQVQCLTFGEPRSLTSGYDGVQPACHWRYCSDGDPVTVIPDNQTRMARMPWFTPIAVTFTPPDWQHYGTQLTLYAGGEINVPTPPPDPLPPGVTTNIIGQHLLENYEGRLRSWNEAH